MNTRELARRLELAAEGKGNPYRLATGGKGKGKGGSSPYYAEENPVGKGKGKNPGKMPEALIGEAEVLGWRAATINMIGSTLNPAIVRERRLMEKYAKKHAADSSLVNEYKTEYLSVMEEAYDEFYEAEGARTVKQFQQWLDKTIPLDA